MKLNSKTLKAVILTCSLLILSACGNNLSGKTDLSPMLASDATGAGYKVESNEFADAEQYSSSINSDGVAIGYSDDSKKNSSDKEKSTVALPSSTTSNSTITAKTDSTEKLSVHYINVGQGDCELIISGKHAMIIDAGDNNEGTLVQNYLQKHGVGKDISLDYAICTHSDSDHCGGMDVVISKFNIGNTMLPYSADDTKTWEDVLSAVKYKQNPVEYTPGVGETYNLGSASFTIISPEKKNKDDNNNSIGILLTYGNTKFLFTGDAEEEEENDMLSAEKNGLITLKADVYKVNHHGSKTSSTSAFLDAVSPKYAVISCAEGNSYHHPHATVLNELRARGIEVRRTDEEGTVIAESDGTNITWNVPASETWKAGE